jgi:hypothetical protein
MLIAAASAGLMLGMGSSGLADELSIIGSCKLGSSKDVLPCEVSNPFDRAIASLEYSLIASEEGREVPWGFSSGSLSIAGGVEPGETVELEFGAPDLPARAKGRDIRIEVDRARAFDMAGGALNPAGPSGNALNLTDLEADKLTSAIAACWNVGALSLNALRTTIVLSVEVDASGLPDAGSITLVEGKLGSETEFRQAFEAARRAVIRCGARGLPYSAKVGEPAKMQLEFSPDGIRVR